MTAHIQKQRSVLQNRGFQPMGHVPVVGHDAVFIAIQSLARKQHRRLEFLNHVATVALYFLMKVNGSLPYFIILMGREQNR